MTELGIPPDFVALITYLFTEVLDSHNRGRQRRAAGARPSGEGFLGLRSRRSGRRCVEGVPLIGTPGDQPRPADISESPWPSSSRPRDNVLPPDPNETRSVPSPPGPYAEP
jgi:hypothetical protein